VRILLDEQLPRQLAPYFVGHDVRTTQEQGWAGLKNGALLRQALAAGFEVFVTGDKNLEFQQNLKVSGLFVVVLVAPSNTWKTCCHVYPRRWNRFNVASLATSRASMREPCANILPSYPTDILHSPARVVVTRSVRLASADAPHRRGVEWRERRAMIIPWQPRPGAVAL